MQLEDLITKIKSDLSYAKGQKVFSKASTEMKLVEEAGEFIVGVAKGDRANILEELCDVLIVATRYYSLLTPVEQSLALGITNSKLKKLNQIIDVQLGIVSAQ